MGDKDQRPVSVPPGDQLLAAETEAYLKGAGFVDDLARFLDERLGPLLEWAKAMDGDPLTVLQAATGALRTAADELDRAFDVR